MPKLYNLWEIEDMIIELSFTEKKAENMRKPLSFTQTCTEHSYRNDF